MSTLKLNFELDLSKESDRQLVDIISRVKALQAQGIEPSIVGAAQEASHSPLPSVDAVRDVGKKITEAANELADAVPEVDGAKLSYEERARVAAKARWARHKAKKAGAPIPPTAKELKKKAKSDKSNLDYSKATEEPIENYPLVEAMDLDQMLNSRAEQVFQQLVTASHQLPYPDGREVMNGTWRDRPEFQDKDAIEAFDDVEFEDPLDDEFVRSVHEQADQFDQD